MKIISLISFAKKSVASFLILGTFFVSFGSVSPELVYAQDASECNDSIDNDSDGKTDYPDDTDCPDYYGSETAPPPPAPASSVSSRSNVLGPDTYTYRAPGVYQLTTPAGAYKVTVKAWGAGGGGGSGMKTKSHHVSGFGGGGGGYAVGEIAVTPGTVIDVVVGTGGLQGEGGAMSEASIDGAAIAGAGGGGGGLSVGGPGYKTGNSFLSTLATIIVAVAVTYFSAGALSGFISSLSAAVPTTGGTVLSGVIGTGTLVPGSTLATGGITSYTMSAFTVSATTLSTSASTVAILGPTGSAIAAGGVSATFVNPIAQQLSQRDPRQAGGVDGLSGLGFGGVRGGVGAGRGGAWLAGVSASNQPVSGTGGNGYAGYFLSYGAAGGSYSNTGDNPYASSGGAAPLGGAGGDRGRLGRDGSGHGSGSDARAQDGAFPGGGGGGSDTGTGGYGGDGQVVIEFSSDGVTSGDVPQCRDDMNNDPQEDDLKDYPLDPGCSDINDDSEYPNPGTTTNNPPLKPVLLCPANLSVGESGAFSAISVDQDASDKLSFIFDWGDGGSNEVTNISSDQNAVANKSWATAGQKTVTVRVRDSHNPSAYASESSSCAVSVSTTSQNAPQVSVLANPSVVNAGSASNLTWTATNSTSCTASGGWSGARSVSGTENTGPLYTQTTFIITCAGPAGSDSDSVTVGVNSLGNGITYLNVPSVVSPGSQMNVQVKNTGTKTWAVNHDLLISKADLTENLQLRDLNTTLPTQNKTVTFIAPTIPGNYVLRAVEQNIEYFGQNYPFTVAAAVVAPPPTYPPTNPPTYPPVIYPPVEPPFNPDDPNALSVSLNLNKTNVMTGETVTAQSRVSGLNVRYHGLEERFKAQGGDVYGEWQNVGIWCQDDPACPSGATRTSSKSFSQVGSYELRTYAARSDRVAVYSPSVFVTSSVYVPPVTPYVPPVTPYVPPVTPPLSVTGSCAALWDYSDLSPDYTCYSFLGDMINGGAMPRVGFKNVPQYPSSYTAICIDDPYTSTQFRSIPVYCPTVPPDPPFNPGCPGGVCGPGGGGPTVIPDFSVPNMSAIIQMIPTVGGTSRPAHISVGPVGGYSEAITFTVTAPAGFRSVEYSWNGGPLGPGNTFTVSSNANGYPNTTLSLRLSGTADQSAYPASIPVAISARGSDGKTHNFILTLNINRTNTQFQEQ